MRTCKETDSGTSTLLPTKNVRGGGAEWKPLRRIRYRNNKNILKSI